MTETCPICGYPGYQEFYPEGGTTYDICPSCGFESGVDGISWDREERNSTFRRRWIEGGAQWWSPATPPEPGWDGIEQLRRAGLLDRPDEDEDEES